MPPVVPLAEFGICTNGCPQISSGGGAAAGCSSARGASQRRVSGPRVEMASGGGRTEERRVWRREAKRALGTEVFDGVPFFFNEKKRGCMDLVWWAYVSGVRRVNGWSSLSQTHAR